MLIGYSAGNTVLHVSSSPCDVSYYGDDNEERPPECVDGRVPATAAGQYPSDSPDIRMVRLRGTVFPFGTVADCEPESTR